MKDTFISDAIKYIGVDDKTIDLFESQYIVPNGMAYNSYLIMDEKITVMDTVDKRGQEEWLKSLETQLQGKKPDYLVISHMEPDHAGSLAVFVERYPETKLIGNAKTFAMLPQFFDLDVTGRAITVKEGDTLELGSHTLQFFMAPMVHWPEVMVTYEQSEKVLFSADGFGKFGTLDTEEDWACEARRYYFNICGKYGGPVQTLLKKSAALDIQTICPLHGPILKENLEYYVGKYQTWSSYEPEDQGIFIAYASIHGNTKQAAQMLADMLEKKGASKVAITDLTRDDIAEAVEDAFRYDRMVVAASSYDGNVFPPMEAFLHHLKSKNYCNRTVAIVENGSWAPSAGRVMKELLDSMKDITVLDEKVTIKSAVKPDTQKALEALADALINL